MRALIKIIAPLVAGYMAGSFAAAGHWPIGVLAFGICALNWVAGLLAGGE